jgi:hypothetical protein
MKRLRTVAIIVPVVAVMLGLVPPVASARPEPAAQVAAAACPTTPMTVDQLLAADRSCFGAESIGVTGWLAEPWGVGGYASGIVPSWLGEGLTGNALWLKPRGADGCVADDDCQFAFLHVQPGVGPSLAPLERWVRVTGHYDDPLSTTCYWNRVNDPKTPEQSVAACREAFVVTTVTGLPAVTVTVRAPRPSATAVSRSTKVVARLSEPVTGVSAASFVLRERATGKVVKATVTYDVATRTATLQPRATLAGRRAYVITLTPAIGSPAGVRLATTTWTFTTRK